MPPPLDPVDCNNYQYQGQYFNCSQLDRCDNSPDNFLARAACCNCEATLCDPDPTCPDVVPPPVVNASSCMGCHNGSQNEDYLGTGISNPHPFGGAAYLSCTACHGGNAQGLGKNDSHVPPPPEIGNRQQQQQDPYAYFNALTHAGIDKLPNYTVNNQTYSAIDYLQFINPGDLRAVSVGRSCGAAGCHGAGQHGDWVSRSPLATSTGFISSTLYTSGLPNAIPEYRGWYTDTAADYGIRAVQDPAFQYNPAYAGRVGQLLEWPEKAQYGGPGIYDNPLYDANQLANQVYAVSQNNGRYANQVIPGSPLQDLITEIVGITCGDCHLTGRGANNRYADFRSSGCTACHMEYSPDGRSRSTDPNVPKLEPANPDAIAAPERPHVDSHQIRNVAKILPGGAFVRGISDYACVGCHQGSNRTVLQYWGIRLDQNEDVVNNVQYPANPVTFVNTANDQRLFDPGVNNQTFNGRNPNQYLLFEDYDGDGRDDTPQDIHHEKGMGCIDCHGSRDVHNGTAGDDSSGRIYSRQNQVPQIACESCHGGIEEYAHTAPCDLYTGEPGICATDLKGNPLRNVYRDPQGNMWLRSRVTGQVRFVPQTRDVIYNNNKRNPLNNQLIYTPKASYAMGRADNNLQTGIGPKQQNPNLINNGFAHTDSMECVTCHASWANNCIGCHLRPGYDANPANYFFSNITGERIVLFQANADFTYISVIPFFLGVGSRNLITQNAAGMKVFFAYDQDLNGNTSQVLSFTDRNGGGNNPDFQGRGAFGALAHNKIMPHSQRGAVNATNEGPRYCNACHLNEQMINDFGAEYAQFYADMQNGNIANLDFNLLQQHIGQNTNNALNSPFFVHMVAGLGSGLFYFDAEGCPVNPLDPDANRKICANGAPADNFDANNAVFAADRVVENTGISNASNAHPMLNGGPANYRIGAIDPFLAGPLGTLLVQKLADPNVGLILDSWIDSDGNAQGQAANFIQ